MVGVLYADIRKRRCMPCKLGQIAGEVAPGGQLSMAVAQGEEVLRTTVAAAVTDPAFACCSAGRPRRLGNVGCAAAAHAAALLLALVGDWTRLSFARVLWAMGKAALGK